MSSGGKANGDREPDAFAATRRASGERRLWETTESTERELLVVRVRSAHASGPDAPGPGAPASDEFDAGLRASGLRVIQTRGIEETAAATDHYGAQVLLVDIEPASPADLMDVCRVLLARYPDLPVVSLFPEDASHPVGVYAWGARLCLRRGRDSDPAILGPLLVNLVQSAPSTTLRVGNVRIDTRDRLVFVANAYVTLTECDVDILTLLVERRGVLPDRDLLTLPCVNGTVESARKSVIRLREKLLEASATLEIKTVRGRGFRVMVTE